MQVSRQAFERTDQNMGRQITKQDALKFDVNANGQLSKQGTEQAGLNPQDLNILNQALEKVAELEPAEVLFQMPAQNKAQAIAAVQRLSTKVTDANTLASDFSEHNPTVSDTSASVLSEEGMQLAYASPKSSQSTAVKSAHDIRQVFMRSGLSSADAARLSSDGLKPEQAQILFNRLMSNYGKDLGKVGPQMVAAAILQTAATRSQGLSAGDISHMVEQFQDKAFVRADGYMSDYLSGKAYDYKVGEPAFKNGQLIVQGIPAGTMYANRQGVFHAVDPHNLRRQDTILELPLSGGIPILDNALDGVGDSLKASLEGIHKVFTSPIDQTLAGLSQLPTHVGALIKASPDYARRFVAMPFAQQQREAARITTDIVSLGAGTGGALKLVAKAGDLGKIPMASLKLNANGTLAVSSTIVDISQANQLMAAGASTFMMMGTAHNRAEFQKYIDSLSHGMEKPLAVKDPKLNHLIEEMYRGNAEIGSGSTADALRFEKQTGVKVGGLDHRQKTENFLQGLKNWVNNSGYLKDSSRVSAHDYHVAKRLIADLENALQVQPLSKQQAINRLKQYLHDFPNGNAATRASAQQRLRELTNS